MIELLYEKHNDQPIHGVIGPYHPESAKMFAYIFGRNLTTLQVLKSKFSLNNDNNKQVSYSVTSVLLENSHRYPYFHTTIPNDEYYSVVISKLLDHFDWQKVAILSTNDDKSVLVRNLTSLSLSFSLPLFLSLSPSLTPSLPLSLSY